MDSRAGCALACVRCFTCLMLYPDIKFPAPCESRLPRYTWFIENCGLGMEKWIWHHMRWLRGVLCSKQSVICNVYCPNTRPSVGSPLLCIVVTMDDGHKYRPGLWQENFPPGPASVSWPHLPGLDYWGGAIGRRKGSCYRRKQLKLLTISFLSKFWTNYFLPFIYLETFIFIL